MKNRKKIEKQKYSYVGCRPGTDIEHFVFHDAAKRNWSVSFMVKYILGKYYGVDVKK